MLPMYKLKRAEYRLTIVASGDSYTATDFDPKKEQPSPSNPFGNPSLPNSSSVDRKWIHYLAMTYNRTAIQTYNMARFGATMDGFVRYYHELYMPHYGISNHTKATGWNSTNTLFATFYGINDVRRCTDQLLTKNDCSEIYETLFTIYGFLLEQVSNFCQRLCNESLSSLLFITKAKPPPHTALHHRWPQLPHSQYTTFRSHALLSQMGSPCPSPRRLRLEYPPLLPREQPYHRTPRHHSLLLRHARPL